MFCWYCRSNLLQRLGIAHLIGQLGLQANPEKAVEYLHRSATLATANFPQAPFLFGLLLLDKTSEVHVPSHLLSPYIPAGSSAAEEAVKYMEQTAYLSPNYMCQQSGCASGFSHCELPFHRLIGGGLTLEKGRIENIVTLTQWLQCNNNCAFVGKRVVWV
jgi:hypothetical protein